MAEGGEGFTPIEHKTARREPASSKEGMGGVLKRIFGGPPKQISAPLSEEQRLIGELFDELLRKAELDDSPRQQELDKRWEEKKAREKAIWEKYEADKTVAEDQAERDKRERLSRMTERINTLRQQNDAAERRNG